MRALIVIALVAAMQPALPPPRPVGVLVGVHRHVDYAMQSGADRQPPAGGELRTIWISAGGPEPIVPIEIPDLLLPRRTGFWRLGLLGWCAEEPHKDADHKIDGVEAMFGDHLWAVPIGRRPEVRVGSKTWLDVPIVAGPCASRDVYCTVDLRTWIHWVWPEYVSMANGSESGCGAHPDGSFGYTVQRPGSLGGELTIGHVLGSAVQRRFERAFQSALKKADPCGEPAHFQPSTWHVVRVPGGWKAEGWSDTHRLCGYGVDFAVDVDLSRITGRSDDRALWPPLKKKMPLLTDAHFSPDGRWVVATTTTELRFFDLAAMDRAVIIPLARGDDVVMVEWATGVNVPRWHAAVQQAREAGAVKAVVLR
jgi:hypothetical protein